MTLIRRVTRNWGSTLSSISIWLLDTPLDWSILEMACGPLSEEKKATQEVQDICDEVCSHRVTKKVEGREVFKEFFFSQNIELFYCLI